MYDYVPGKSGWLAAGLPREGRDADVVLVGDVLTEIPTCAPDTPLEECRDRAKDGRVAVLDHDRVVMGVLDPGKLGEAPADATAEDVMHPAPTTTRASTDLEDIIHRMEHAGVSSVLVTSAEGRLLGLLEIERAREAVEAGVR